MIPSNVSVTVSSSTVGKSTDRRCLSSASGAEEASFDKPSEFAGALRQALSDAGDIELLFAIWEQNVDTVRALNRSLKQDALPKSGFAPQLVNHLKQCAIALVRPENRGSNQKEGKPAAPSSAGVRLKIDKSVLAINELKRIRCKEHLRFVASQPCLVCGRTPSYAHHVRYAQPRGLSLKVSDEFTVPHCAIHHHHIHTTGKEREWWQERNIDPLAVASRLWRQQNSEHFSAVREASGVVENGVEKRTKPAQPNEPDAKLGAGTNDSADPARGVNSES